MLRTLSSNYFLVQITDREGSGSDAIYSFVECWHVPAETQSEIQQKAGGRYGDKDSNPGRCLTGGELQIDDYALCRSADGEGGWTWELLPIAEGDPPTTTTTTTTTTTPSPTPCTGDCSFDWNASTKQWEPGESTCSSDCACFAPTWCPDVSMTCASTRTACGQFGTDQPLPNCTGTTTTPGPGNPCNTTTTTTTTPSDCSQGCNWYCDPVRGWLLKSNKCSSVDDSDRWHLTCVGAADLLTRFRTDVTALPADVRSKLHVQCYAPTDWPVSQFALPTGVSLRKPSPVRSSPEVGTIAATEYSTGKLDTLLAPVSGKQPEPAPAPKPIEPKQPDQPKQPDPTPPPAPTPAPTPTPVPAPVPNNGLLALIAVVLMVIWSLSRRG